MIFQKNSITDYESCVSRFKMDLPIFPKQASKLEVELENLLDGGAHEWIWRLCDGIECDESDSSYLKVYWCSEAMRFLAEQQRRYITAIFERAIEETELAQYLMQIARYQNGEKFECAEEVELYLDTQIAAGYSISIDDELDVVPEEYRDVLYTYVAQLRLANAA